MSLMKKLSLILSNIIVFYFLFFIFTSIASDKIVGLPKIIDGDTIEINSLSIRFGGIDAPESFYKGKTQLCFDKISKEKLYCGALSKKFLKRKIQNKEVVCIPEKGLDHYGRIIGECFIGNESLSTYMVKSGYAFDYKKYSKGKYENDQEYAKKERAGLWKTNFDYPWIWRKNNK